MKSIKLLKNCAKETSILCNLEIKVLKNLLDMEMHGIEGLPALFFDNLQKTLNLETYEILYNDPLHCIFHNMQNFYNELPKHLPKI